MSYLDHYVKLMLHMNGADASTTFTDSSYAPHAVTANGNAQIDTAQYKWTASGLFDGTNSYLSTADSDDFYYGTGDVTIDFFVRFAALPTSGNYMFIYNQRVSADDVVEFSLYNNSGTYQWSLNSYASAALKANITRDTTLSTDTWYHIAFVRESNNLMLFQQGSKLGSNEVDAEEIPNVAASVDIGRWSGGGYYLNGWIDEFRISKGIARWNTTFTPPTEECTNEASLDGGVGTSLSLDTNFVEISEEVSVNADVDRSISDGTAIGSSVAVGVHADVTTSIGPGASANVVVSGNYYVLINVDPLDVPLPTLDGKTGYNCWTEATAQLPTLEALTGSILDSTIQLPTLDSTASRSLSADLSTRVALPTLSASVNLTGLATLSRSFQLVTLNGFGYISGTNTLSEDVTFPYLLAIASNNRSFSTYVLEYIR